MISVGETFYTQKSGELVTAIEEPKARSNGNYTVLVRKSDGSTRYTTVKP
jgi:arginyl-tRNA synthetase